MIFLGETANNFSSLKVIWVKKEVRGVHKRRWNVMVGIYELILVLELFFLNLLIF
jgi:hypothetical protein